MTTAISFRPSLGPQALEEFKRATVARAEYPISPGVAIWPAVIRHDGAVGGIL